MKIKYMCPVVGLVAVLLAVPALAQGYFHELPVASASPITSDGFLPSIHPDGSVVAYIDSAENAHLWDVWSGVEVDLPFDPGDYDKVSQCVWGDSILFCKASFRRSNRTNYVVAAYDYVGDKMDEYPMPDGLFKLRGAYGNSAIAERDVGWEVVLVTYSREGSILSGATIVATASDPHRAVIGLAGLYPPIGPYVVYQTKDSSTNVWSLHAWDIVKNMVVASREVGLDMPSPSDLTGTAFFEAGTPSTIWRWDPSEPSGGTGEPGEPEPEPAYPIYTPMVPSHHNCTSLHDMKYGPYFAVVRGEGCSDAISGHGLYVVTAYNDSFVYRWPNIYQPFFVGSLEDEDAGNYSISEDAVVFWDQDGNLEIVWVDLSKVAPPAAFSSPTDDNQYNPVLLHPWNVGSSGSGTIDYASGGSFQDWSAYLLADQEYRIIVVSDSCANWESDTRLSIFTDNGKFMVEDNESGAYPQYPKCAGTIFKPSSNDYFRLRIDRAERGVIGIAPSMPYDLAIEAL